MSSRSAPVVSPPAARSRAEAPRTAAPTRRPETTAASGTHALDAFEVQAPERAGSTEGFPLLRRACECGGGASGGCEECKRKEGPLRRSGVAPGPAVAPPVVHEVLASPGRPLDESTRAMMEPRFGHSFADVRVHVDARAAESARAVGARAYAVGRDVVFAQGRYQPGHAEGRRLLAHELAHVVQQRSAPAPLRPRHEVGASDDPAEREADAAAERVMAGAPAGPLGAQGGGLALRRQEGGPQIGPEAPRDDNEGVRGLYLRIREDGRLELVYREPGLPVGTFGLGVRFDGRGPEVIGTRDPLRLGDTYSPSDARRLVGPTGQEPRPDAAAPTIRIPQPDDALWARIMAERLNEATSRFLRLREDPEWLRLTEPRLGQTRPTLTPPEPAFRMPSGPRLGGDLQIQLPGGPILPPREGERLREPLQAPERSEPSLGVPPLRQPQVPDPFPPTLDLDVLGLPYHFRRSRAPPPADAPPGTVPYLAPLPTSTARAVGSRLGVHTDGPEYPPTSALYLIYFNDGRGPFPNLGLGSDQGLTAFMRVGRHMAPQGAGFTDAAFVHEMVTPPGDLPAGAPRDATQQYTVPHQTWLGLFYGTFTYRLRGGNGTPEISAVWHLGANSLDVGHALQDFIHTQISDSPTFPWPSGIEPYLGLGARIDGRTPDLDLKIIRGRIELSADALGTTHRSHAGAGFRIVAESAEISLRDVPVVGSGIRGIRLVASGGASARIIARYNDGREAPLAGFEGSLDYQLGIDVRLRNANVLGATLTNLRLTHVGNLTASSDPAFQVSRANASTVPEYPFAGRGPHGTGGLMLMLHGEF